MAGSILFTGDSAVINAGRPIRIFNMHVLSDGVGGGVVTLKNGKTASGTAWITETGTTSTGVTFDYGMYGHYFPDGCFVDIGANITSVLIGCE